MPSPTQIIPCLLLSLILSLTTWADDSAAPSDEDAWAFIVYLYGFDAEECARLEQLEPSQKVSYIQSLRQSEIAIKNPANFTPEEQQAYDAMRNSFREEKQAKAEALRVGDTITEEELATLVDLSKSLIENWRDQAKTPRHIQQLLRGSLDAPIPNGWEFLNPQKIRVRTNTVEIYLYTNPYQPNGPQVVFDVSPDPEEDFYWVRYSTNISIGKSWRIAPPVAKKQTSYGPR